MPRMSAFVVFAVTLSACAGGTVASQPDSAPSVVAVVGERQISLRDTDELRLKAEPDTAAGPARAVHEGRRRAMFALVEEAVIAQAAAQEGKAPTEWFAAAVAARLMPASDDDLRAEYVKDPRPDKPDFETLKPLLAFRVNQDRQVEVRRLIVDEYARTSFKVEILLEPYRQPVPLSGTEPADGPAGAPVTVVVFTDYTSADAGQMDAVLAEAWRRFDGQIRIVTLGVESGVSLAREGAVAARCAADQGNGAEFRAYLVAQQRPATPDLVGAIAVKLGLDPAAFGQCIADGRHDELIRRWTALARTLEVRGVPAVFINGRPVDAPDQYGTILELIADEMKLRRPAPGQD